MEKLQTNQILIQDAKLVAVKLSESEDATAERLISEAKKSQAEVLKLKDVKQENLRMVVKL